MSLASILEEIKKVKPFADEDITEGPRETYAGREGRKRNARDQLKRFKEQYIDELRKNAVFIIVSGTNKDQFAELAKGEFGCFLSDSEAFYKDLANRLPEELYKNKSPTANLFEIMGRHLEDKANEMQLMSYPQLVMKQQYRRVVDGREDFASLIKQAINEQVGSEIVGINAIRNIADAAIEVGHSSKITPIIMTTDDENFALDLNKNLGRIGSKVFLVAAGKGAKTVRSITGAFALKEVTKESIENTLANIKNLIKR